MKTFGLAVVLAIACLGCAAEAQSNSKPGVVVTPPGVVVTAPAKSVQAPQRAVGAPDLVSKVWFASDLGIHNVAGGSDLTLCVQVRNLSTTPAPIRFTAVTATGPISLPLSEFIQKGDPRLPGGISGPVQAGGMRTQCLTPNTPGYSDVTRSEFNSFWLLVHSTVPVSVRVSNNSSMYPGAAVPLDCSNPTGIEYACNLVNRPPGNSDSATVKPR